ncbi:MAG: flagellar basal body rod protein FlgB [Cyanobacteria bacterium P01_F01_bin.33]
MSPIKSAMGMTPQIMEVRAKRLELLSANIANSDTPGYKARDIDFASVMGTAQNAGSAMKRTHEKHLAAANQIGGYDVKYRAPTQPSADGNTVDTHREHAAFMDNAVRYQASLNFLDGRIRGLRIAIRGQV